jgi:SAM-dependent methyltransferase
MERDAWDERYAKPDLVWSRQPNKFVFHEVAGMAPGRALDLGAGEGRHAIWLASLGWRVTAVDFSPVALAKAAALASSQDLQITLLLEDIRSYQPAPGAFDLVLIAYLQLPWPDFEPILHRAAAAVAPGGTLLVVGHDIENLSRGYGGPQNPALLHRLPDIVAALPSLAIVRAEQAARTVHTEAGEQVAIDTVVRAQSRPPAAST